MKFELNDLLSKIEVLEAKNAALSDRAEDSLLFGMIAEMIYQTDDTILLIDQILQRISLLKNIPFCACFERVESGINMLGFYASFADFNTADIQLSFPECAEEDLFEDGHLIMEEVDFAGRGFSFRILGRPFLPQKALIIRCPATSTTDKYFMFLDDTKKENQFSKMRVLLQQITQLACERMEKISIFEELSKLNLQLDQRVNERTMELIRINESLNNEIKDRKSIELALSKNEQKLRSIFDAAIDVSFITVDLSGRSIIRRFSPGSEKMFGYSADEVIGKSLSKLHLPDHAELLSSIHKDLVENGLSRREEIILRRKSGELFPAILTVYPLKDGDGKLSGALSISIDVTELKRTQNEFSKAKVKAEENEYKFKNLFEQASDGIFINDSEGNYLEVNESGCEMLGFSRDELLKMNLKDVILKESLVTNPIKIPEMQTEKVAIANRTLVRKNGSVFSAEISGKMLSDGRMLGIVRDNTERLMFEKELIVAKEKAEESDRLKTAFLQNMSHEIRTPMNAIMGFSDLLPEYFGDEEKLRRYAKIIKQRGVDLLEIITDILDIAKIESGQLPVTTEECKMSELFVEIETLLYGSKVRYDRNSVEFDLKFAKNVKELDVIIDQTKLKQILNNLIGNAFKFTNSGKIEVGCNLFEPNVFTFYVSDTGIGISKEKYDEIFNCFRKASNDKSRFYGGTGLGLSIVQGLLQLLGGNIWLESEKGKGSTFYFTVPFSMNVHHFHNFSEADLEKPFSHRNVRILIVEDDEFNAEYLLEILSDTDYTILQTRYGREAIEICKKQAVDLVLMDIRLPDISGYQVTSRVKKLRPEIKVIVQTAYATSDDEQKSHEAGCDDYLSKPIGRELLWARINHHLSSKIQ